MIGVLSSVQNNVGSTPEPASEIAWSDTDKSADISLSDGNKLATKTGGSRAGAGAESLSAKSSGRWYVEFYIQQATSSFVACGFSEESASRTVDLGQNSKCYGYHKRGARYFSGSYSASAYSSFASGDTIGMAVDFGAGTVEFYKNNASQGLESISLSAVNYVPAMSADSNSSAIKIMSEADYLYSPPSGFSAWSS